MPEDNKDLDEFDLDLFADDDDDELEQPDAGEAGDEYVPKARVEKVVKKRLARERAKFEALARQFNEVYGMTPEEVLEVGRKARQGALPGTPVQAGVGASPAPAPTGQVAQAGGTQAEVPPDIPTAPIALDPLARQELEEIKRWRQQLEHQTAVEREAQEFVALFPDVKFEDIPREVLERRARGGVTLAEAYMLHTAAQREREALKKGAQGAVLDIERKRRARTEGPDVTGGAEDAVGSLTEEEREFARAYGMTPKEYVRYKQLASKYTGREEE